MPLGCAVAIYAIGDIQGCFEAFTRLLRRIDFQPQRDRMWLAGDLVNRGPDSLGVLRWVTEHDACVSAVLGNHDLHLLARAAGVNGVKRRDTLEEVLHAPDRDDLLAWLRQRPLVFRENGWTMVHAGLKPSWSVEDAEQISHAFTAELLGPRMPLALRALREPEHAPPDLQQLGTDAGLLTRIRTCTPAGDPAAEFAGPPEDAPPGFLPWFRVPHRKSQGDKLIFGHWSALGLLNEPTLVALDTGCVWGHALTAVRLDDRAVFQVPALLTRLP